MYKRQVIGGDGSFRGALELSKRGIQCIGIPGTIDNDIAASDYTIGFDTAMNNAVEMADKIRDTIDVYKRQVVNMDPKLLAKQILDDMRESRKKL